MSRSRSSTWPAMPLSLRRGTVSAIREQNEELVRLLVDGEPCLAYPRLTGPVEVGDEVIVNTQARDLGLGSGGFNGMSVVCCSLHRQVAPVCAGLRRRHRLRVAYVQLGGGALPVSLSDSVRVLKRSGYLEVAVAVAPCVDGDVEAVTPASALAWCSAQGFDVVVCSMGPGIVGTASALGHGGLGVVEAANTAAGLGGSPVLAVRYSEADPRERHRGVSHHTQAILELSAAEGTVAGPQHLEAPDWLSPREEVDVEGWHEECGRLPLSHMGRGLGEDPCFFR